jgi:hypothetical protein
LSGRCAVFAGPLPELPFGDDRRFPDFFELRIKLGAGNSAASGLFHIFKGVIFSEF